jgi:dihydroorotase-like cyclic amidohydrolase
MSLPDFARFSATNSAKAAGLYPRKGTILPGSDADLALYDLNAEWTVDPREQQFSKNPSSPFEGRHVRGKVVRTIVRGTTVYCEGEITAEPGHGTFLSSQDEHRLAAAPARIAEMAR